MTAGMTTQKLGESRISLPRAGLGAVLAITLVAGGMIGAALYAGIGPAVAQPAGAAVSVGTTPTHESTVVRELRLAAGRGQLIGEPQFEPVTDGTSTTNVPAAGDGFVSITHAPGRGPLP